MKTKFTAKQQKIFGHAAVIGGSISGLLAARVLSDTFAQVTIIERDRLSDMPEFRPGVPQTRHAHSLPLRGQAILEQHFPGLVDELCANGAETIKASQELAFFLAGSWHEVRQHGSIVSITFSRPLLETLLYRRLAAQPGMRFIHQHEVAGLSVDRQRRRVTGLRLRHRGSTLTGESELAADLVIDASGRNSAAPQWLAEWGYQPPQETVVKSFAGYASRLYRRPAEFGERWKTLYIRPTPDHSSRGGLIIPIEGDRWQVTLMGIGRDYPPTDEAGFLEFAHSLPTPHLYQAIQQAEPLTKPYGYRTTENRLRHYEQLPRYLEGFLVCGDSAVTLNPVYAQGMTAAALASLALADALQAEPAGDLTGLARAFQTQLSQVVAGPWQMATREDQRWPETEVIEQTEAAQARPQSRRTVPLPSRPARPARRPSSAMMTVS